MSALTVHEDPPIPHGNLNNWAKVCHAVSVDHGFWERSETVDSLPARLMLIDSEVAEVLEAYRALPDALALDRDAIRDAIAEEVADIFIRVADLAGHYGIDLGRAVRDKVDRNRARPRMHGKLL